MDATTRVYDAALPFDSFEFDEEARHPCLTTPAHEAPFRVCRANPARNPRCAPANREWLRVRFPREQ